MCFNRQQSAKYVACDQNTSMTRQKNCVSSKNFLSNSFQSLSLSAASPCTWLHSALTDIKVKYFNMSQAGASERAQLHFHIHSECFDRRVFVAACREKKVSSRRGSSQVSYNLFMRVLKTQQNWYFISSSERGRAEQTSLAWVLALRWGREREEGGVKQNSRNGSFWTFWICNVHCSRFSGITFLLEEKERGCSTWKKNISK